MATPKDTDPTQSLSNEGRSQAGKAAAYTAKHARISVTNIFHSGKLRAKQTAEEFAQALKPRDGVRETDSLNPMDDPSIWANRLATETENLMLVGHLPHLGKLAGHLLCNDEKVAAVSFHNVAIVCLRRDDVGAWSLNWMLVPDILPD